MAQFRNVRAMTSLERFDDEALVDLGRADDEALHNLFSSDELREVAVNGDGNGDEDESVSEVDSASPRDVHRLPSNSRGRLRELSATHRWSHVAKLASHACVMCGVEHMCVIRSHLFTFVS